MSASAMLKVLGPQATEQLRSLRDKLPLQMATELLVMWQESNPQRFKSLASQGQILPLLEQQDQLLSKATDLEASPQADGLVRHEIMQMCSLPLTLQEALGTKPP